MEWLNRCVVVIVYLEEHMEDEIDLAQMAQIACCSFLVYYVKNIGRRQTLHIYQG